MEILKNLLPYAQIVLSLLLVIGIVLQQRGASLGGAFGSDGGNATYYKRRGAEKFLFSLTIIVAILFIATNIFAFLTA